MWVLRFYGSARPDALLTHLLNAWHVEQLAKHKHVGVVKDLLDERRARCTLGRLGQQQKRFEVLRALHLLRRVLSSGTRALSSREKIGASRRNRGAAQSRRPHEAERWAGEPSRAATRAAEYLSWADFWLTFVASKSLRLTGYFLAAPPAAARRASVT